jgi:hypothetical protein
MGSLARNSKRSKPAPFVRPSSKSHRQPARRPREPPPPSNHAVHALLTAVRLRLETITACTVVVVVALRAQTADNDLDAALVLQRCVCDPLAVQIETLENALASGGAP